MDFSRRFWSRSVWVPSLVVGLLMLIAWSVRWRQNSERGVEAVRQQVVELLQRAEQNLNAGRTAAARKNYETVLELNPAEPVALLFMAGYLQQEGHSDDARALLARLGPVSDQLQATADFLLGGLELQSGRAVIGEQLLLSAHHRNSRYAAPLRDLARLYALQMRATEQNQMLLLLEQIRPLTKEELAMRLLAGRPITETKQATEQLRGYLQQAPEDRASLLGLLRTLRLDQSPQQVLAELDRHAELERSSAALQALRAILQLQSGADQVTSRYVRQLDVGQSADEEVWELAVRMAERSGDWEQMRRAAGWLVQLQPWQPAFRSFLALACERQGDTTEAQRQRVLMGRLDQLELLAWRMFRPQAEAESMIVPVMLELADLLRASDESGEARRWLSAAARLQPQNAEIAQQLAALSAVLEPARSLTESAPEMRPIVLQAAADSVQTPATTVAEDWKFVDESAARGVRFSYHNGQTEWKRIVETVGGGCAVLDLDGDLWPDLYFAQGQSAARQAEGRLDTLLEDQIFRNLRGQRFQNCTDLCGMHETSHTLAATVGDVDGDGFADVLAANLGTCRLYRNAGDGTFFEATPVALQQSVHCSSGACLVDLNDDGLPEIFILNYVEDWDRRCINSSGQFATCDPRELRPAICQLFLNEGDGEFRELTTESGLAQLPGRALGVIAAELTGDQRIDLFIANDGMPNQLLTCDVDVSGVTGKAADLHLTDVAARSGVAVPESGRAHAGMGVAYADFDRNGFPDLFVTNFYREQNTLYEGIASGLFTDASSRSGLGPVSLPWLGFGTQPIDVQGDGWPDLVVLNGDIDDYSASGRPWKMPIMAFRNEGGLRFRDMSQSSGVDFQQPQLGRGLSRVDLNGDHVCDLVAVRHDGEARLLVNHTPQQSARVVLRVIGRQRGREVLGTVLTLHSGGPGELTEVVTGGDGFAAVSERVVSFRRGAESSMDLAVRWPGGVVQRAEVSGASVEWLCREETGAECSLWRAPR